MCWTFGPPDELRMFRQLSRKASLVCLPMSKVGGVGLSSFLGVPRSVMIRRTVKDKS